MGWLFRDLEDAPLLASFFAPTRTSVLSAFTRFAVVDKSFLLDCEPEIVASLHSTVRELEALGLQATTINFDWWADAFDIFAPIQAWEAACIHAGHFDRIDASIRERLKWGARIAWHEIAALRQRHEAFRTRMDELLATYELVLLPAIPVQRLTAGADHSQTRSRLLRYTVPFSLGGNPAVVIPCAFGGMQLVAARNRDEDLVRLAAQLGAARNTAASLFRP
jgi:aspartyl-tRNA(Asn)/glutamyl-tRNA(Gln) amidotransferase subunit A